LLRKMRRRKKGSYVCLARPVCAFLNFYSQFLLQFSNNLVTLNCGWF
jgi:hypothetical protein